MASPHESSVPQVESSGTTADVNEQVNLLVAWKGHPNCELPASVEVAVPTPWSPEIVWEMVYPRHRKHGHCHVSLEIVGDLVGIEVPQMFMQSDRDISTLKLKASFTTYDIPVYVQMKDQEPPFDVLFLVRESHMRHPPSIRPSHTCVPLAPSQFKRSNPNAESEDHRPSKKQPHNPWRTIIPYVVLEKVDPNGKQKGQGFGHGPFFLSSTDTLLFDNTNLPADLENNAEGGQYTCLIRLPPILDEQYTLSYLERFYSRMYASSMSSSLAHFNISRSKCYENRSTMLVLRLTFQGHSEDLKSAAEDIRTFISNHAGYIGVPLNLEKHVDTPFEQVVPILMPIVLLISAKNPFYTSPPSSNHILELENTLGCVLALFSKDRGKCDILTSSNFIHLFRIVSSPDSFEQTPLHHSPAHLGFPKQLFLKSLINTLQACFGCDLTEMSPTMVSSMETKPRMFLLNPAFRIAQHISWEYRNAERDVLYSNRGVG